MNIIIAACFIFTQIATYIQTLAVVMNKLYSFPQIKGFQEQKRQLSSLKKAISRKNNDCILNSRNFNLNSNFKKELDAALKNRNRNRKSTTQSIAYVKDKPLESIKSIEFLEENISISKSLDISKRIMSLKDSKGKIESKKLENDSFHLKHYSEENEKEDQSSAVPKGKKAEIKKTKKSESNKEKVKKSKIGVLKEKIKQIFFKNKKKIFTVDFFQYLFTKFKRAFKLNIGEMGKMILQAEKKYCEELDIINLLHKIHDIEKLKILLLDPDQLALFNCLTKPLIFSDIDFTNLADISETRMSLIINNYRKKKDLTLSYERVLAKNSEINQKLISFVDEKIAQTFAKNY
jgi:hypothetical protein